MQHIDDTAHPELCCLQSAALHVLRTFVILTQPSSAVQAINTSTSPVSTSLRLLHALPMQGCLPLR